MKSRIHIALAGAALSMPVVVTLAASATGLPGDRGVMGGLGALTAPPPAATAPAAPPRGRPPSDVPVPGPSIQLALKAAQAIAEACKQYPYGMAVVDSSGSVKLIYVPDGAVGWHGYSAIRKAYTALTFKSDTSKVIAKAHEDPSIVEKFKSDPNLQAQAGGVVLMAGDKVIGAIGVSGAEPGGHDEECGNVGREKIKNDLK
jgi:uncharacterized protein GlcG (DUF336 family)